MKSFLETLALYYKEQEPGSGKEFCILFPNRRSGLFFKKHLSKLFSGYDWLPEILTIDDFTGRLTPLQKADPIELSFEIYQAYKSITQTNEDFDEFYSWGEMMISDFNDADKYMVDTAALFTNLNDLKEIDDVFDYLSDEQKKLIAKFWNHFLSNDDSREKEMFLTLWKVLNPVYMLYKKSLRKKNMAYEGMIYRDIAENLSKGEGDAIPWKKIWICGFNALSTSEYRIFNHLKNAGIASFFWDYDLEYINIPLHESGHFMRKNLEMFPPEEGFNPGFDNLRKRKNICITSLPSDILQAKELYAIIDKNMIEDQEKEFNHTAVILGDESLLLPVLMSLPESVKHLNITMGYPVTQTPVYSFTDSLMKMQMNFSNKKNRSGFYFRDILSVLNHQYLKSFYREKTELLIHRIKSENLIYIKQEELGNDPVFNALFKKAHNETEMMDYLLGILDTILEQFPEEENTFVLEREYIFHIRTRLIKVKNLFNEMDLQLNLEIFIRLFRKILADFRIPFSGEPLQGVQIMGILESRLLDFEHVILLSVNEGVMPASQASVSYIPVNLRHAFGMPVKKDKDAIYAYYFYRLLQRATNADILYNSKSDGVKSGEPARYIHQIQYLSHWKPEWKTRSFEVSGNKIQGIHIEKGQKVMAALDKYIQGKGERYLSPSAITTYLDCSLRFYFSYIAEIREEDEVTEDIDPSGFGNLYHKTMELIYDEACGRMLDQRSWEAIADQKNIDEKLNQAFKSEVLAVEDSELEVKPEGRNIIVYEIIKKMVKQTLRVDKKLLSFFYVKSEEKINDVFINLSGGRKVRIGGKIDRLDRRNNKVYVIDYKTGAVSMDFPGFDILFDRDQWTKNVNYKGVFQTFMYSYLYTQKYPEEVHVVPGIYSIRNLFSNTFSPLLKNKPEKRPVLNYLELAGEFQEKFSLLMNEIFNENLAFEQTEDEERCKYCLYKDICHKF